jgi:hypothetical protein
MRPNNGASLFSSNTLKTVFKASGLADLAGVDS